MAVLNFRYAHAAKQRRERRLRRPSRFPEVSCFPTKIPETLREKEENTSSRFRSRETNSKLALGNFSNYKIIVARVILTFISFDKNIKVIE